MKANNKYLMKANLMKYLMKANLMKYLMKANLMKYLMKANFKDEYPFLKILISEE